MILTIIGPHWLKRQNATYTFSFYIIKNNFLRLLRVEWSLRSSFLFCFRINPMHYFFFQFLFNHIKSIVNGIFHQIHSLLCNLLFYYSVSNNFLTMKDVKLITGSFYFTSWVGAKIQLVHRYQFLLLSLSRLIETLKLTKIGNVYLARWLKFIW